MNTRIKELQETIEKAQAELNSLQNAGKRWRADHVGYFAIGLSGSIGEYSGICSEIDNYHYSIGNYYRTEAEAIKAMNRMIATQQLKDRIAQLNAEQGFAYDYKKGSNNMSIGIYNAEICKTGWDTTQFAPVELYGSKETIETVIAEMPEQIKLWLGVE